MHKKTSNTRKTRKVDNKLSTFTNIHMLKLIFIEKALFEAIFRDTRKTNNVDLCFLMSKSLGLNIKQMAKKFCAS